MCPRRVSGNSRNSRLYFLDFLSVALLTETAGHHGRKKWDKVKQCPKFLPHQSRSGPLKGTDKTCGTIIAPCLCKINTAAYIRGLYHSYFIFHLLHTVSDKKKKKPSISEQYELLISQPQFLLSPHLPLSSFFSTFQVRHATPFPLSGVFSVGVVLTCELDHLRQFKSLTSGFSLLYFNWFGSRSFLREVSSIGIMNHKNYAFYCSSSNTCQIFKSNKGAFFWCKWRLQLHSNIFRDMSLFFKLIVLSFNLVSVWLFWISFFGLWSGEYLTVDIRSFSAESF